MMKAGASTAVKITASLVILAVNSFTCAPDIATKTPAVRVKNIAVVETLIDKESGAAAQLNAAEVGEITDELRREAVKNLPRGKYNIMTTETVYAQGSAVLEECAEENCVIALGSRIGADYIVRGTIRKFQTMLTLSIELYETENGNLVAFSDPVRSEKPVELLEKAAVACGEMYRKFVDPDGYARSSAQRAPAPQPASPPPQPVAAASQPAYQYSAPTYQTYQTPAPAPASASAPTYQPPGPDRPSLTTFTDGRDGKTYKAVVIGGKRWMAENLNYQPPRGRSWCFGNANSNCDVYGRLYEWPAVMAGSSSSAASPSGVQGVCPSGWHLPSRREWGELAIAAGGAGQYGASGGAGKKLKAAAGWTYGGNGTDDYGFSALAGGALRGNGYNDFVYSSVRGHWWTATTGGSGRPYYRRMVNDSNDLQEFEFDVSTDNFGFSVRCVAN